MANKRCRKSSKTVIKKPLPPLLTYTPLKRTLSIRSSSTRPQGVSNPTSASSQLEQHFINIPPSDPSLLLPPLLIGPDCDQAPTLGQYKQVVREKEAALSRVFALEEDLDKAKMEIARLRGLMAEAEQCLIQRYQLS